MKPESRKAPGVKPPESSFEPELPAEVVRETRTAKGKATTSAEVYRNRKIIEIPDDVTEVTEPGSQSQETKLEAPQFIFQEHQATSDVPLETEAEPEVNHADAEDDGDDEEGICGDG